MTTPNYEYLYKNFKLPSWFNHNDIDWLRYYPTKDDKTYDYTIKRTIYRMIQEEKQGFSKYIYDDEKVNIHKIFVKYLIYLNMDLDVRTTLNTDLTEEEIKQLLSIKVCDYDWLFMWSVPEYDKNSEVLLIQKISV